MKHSKKSPSAAKRWITCPGSINLIDKLGIESGSNKYSAEGTVAHKIGEKCLIESRQPEEFLGCHMSADGFKFIVNDNMINAVNIYVDYILGQIQSNTDVSMNVEVKCSLKSLKVPGMDGGISDVVLINKNKQYIEVVDYKHGQGVVVEIYNNPQAMSYALGAMIKLKVKPGNDWKVYITIVQPRAMHKDGGIRTSALSSDDIWKWANDILIPAGLACDNPDAPLVPSDDGCRFCPAASECPVLYKKTQEIAIANFENDIFPNPKTITSEQKTIVMDNMTIIRAYLLAVEQQVRNEVISGSKDYEGKYKLVRKETKRRLTDDALDELVSPLLDYMNEDELYTKKPKGIGELEKTLKAKFKKNKIKGFTKLSKEIMNKITIKPEGEIVIALESDKRKPVASISDFKDLND